MWNPAPQLYLASASPRRRALLQQMGLRHELVPQAVDESLLAGESPRDYVLRLASAKAAAGLAGLPAGARAPVLGADTTVVCAGRILGKPADRAAAADMLGCLSGQVHQVYTAVALATEAADAAVVALTQVTFRQLDSAEIQAYWETGEPRDKAGAYAIQGLGAMFVKSLSGSYSGVVGLPIFETAGLLASFGIDALARTPAAG